MMRRTRPRLLFIACFLALGAGAALAQSTFATLTGTITDSSNAVLPGATITVTNERTQSVRTSVTDNVGFYQVANLDPGPYRIVATLSGFADQTRHHGREGTGIEPPRSPAIHERGGVVGRQDWSRFSCARRRHHSSDGDFLDLMGYRRSRCAALSGHSGGNARLLPPAR